MTDLLDQIRKDIAARQAELRPAVEEHQLLQAADAALDGLSETPSGTYARSPSRQGRGGRGPGRPRTSAASATPAPPKPASAKPTARRGRRRRKPLGGRAAQALALIQEHPGITVPELAERIGIKQKYFYRLLPPLVKEGEIEKRGRGWHPKDATPAGA